MELIINGTARQCAEGISVKQLMEELKLSSAGVAIERNLEIVPRSQYGDVRLNEGDAIEIVSFIGGG